MDRITQKKRAVLESAGPVFMRYGFARTTMGLIAEAAGMSRPALYLVFPNKEDVFSAVVGWLNGTLLADIKETVSKIPDFEERLFTACDTWSSSVYDVHAESREAEDMDNLKFPAVRALYGRLEEFVEEILSAEDSPLPAGVDKKALANMLVHALRGCRLGCRDKTQMHEMNRLLIASVCCSGT